MSRDFNPKVWWLINNSDQSRDCCLENIRYTVGDKSWNMYTEEELEDRRKHRYLVVTGPDVYKVLRKKLTDEAFEEFHKLLGEMIEDDDKGNDTSIYPKEMMDWYHNRHDHYYHEPNDEELMDYVLNNYETKEKK